jgi:hypothetical protein
MTSLLTSPKATEANKPASKMAVQHTQEEEHGAHMPRRNDIKEIRNHKQLEKVDLDFESPRLKKALFNLGVSKDECIKK